MGALRAFLVGSAKLAVAVVGVVLVLVLGIWGYSSWETRQKELKEAPLATKKEWPKQELLSNIPVDVATAWRDGMTHYQVTISEYSDDKYARTANASITLVFNDADGFKLWEKQIPWGQMTGLTGSDGNGITGYSWAGNDFASADDYARAASMEIVWRGISAKTTPRTVTPLFDKPSPGHVFRVGERVRLPSSRKASNAGILWVEGMDAFLDQVGAVTKIDEGNTIQVDVDQGKYWWAAAWVTPIGVKPK